MSLPTLRVVATWTFAVVIAPMSMQAQSPRAWSAEVEAHLGPAGATAVKRLIDSAAALGVVQSSLERKAVEGVMKGASTERLLEVLRSYVANLRIAASALGPRAGSSAYEAGASAILAGVDVASLRRVRASRPEAEITLPLVVLTDLVMRGVRADTASNYVARLLAADARDADFATLQQAVARSVAAGQPPAEATAMAADRALRSLNPRSRPPDEPRPGAIPIKPPAPDEPPVQREMT